MYITDEQRLALSRSFNKRAMTKSAATQEKVLDWVCQEAFSQELHTIDPEFAKLAWSVRGALNSVGRGLQSAGRGAWNATKAVGRVIRDNPVDSALTAAMFIPGINVGAGAIRAGRLAYGAGRIAYGAARGGQAIAGGTRLARGLSGARNIAGAARTGLSAGARRFATTPQNPMNRQLGLLGSRGTSLTGKVMTSKSRLGGLRAFGRGGVSTGISPYRSLGKTFGVSNKIWRPAGMGVVGLDAAMAPAQARDTAAGRGPMRQLGNAVAGPNPVTGGAVMGPRRRTGGSAAFQSIKSGR